jgi:hypothetical protein
MKTFSHLADVPVVRGYQVGVDGVWGLETAEVTKAALQDLGLNTNISTG